jgi:hypothetical protein
VQIGSIENQISGGNFMKRFLFAILFVSVFCIGLGALADRAGANFKSDEKALALIQKARQAIGGDAAIANIQSMVIAGKTSRTLKVDGTQKSVQGETEIAMQLPDKLMKMIKIGEDNGEAMKMQQIDVVAVGADKDHMKVTVSGEGQGSEAGSSVRRIVLKKDDGTTQDLTGAEADKVVAADGGKAGDNVKKIIIKRPDGTTQEITGADADKFVADHGDTLLITKENTGSGERVDIRRAGPSELHDSMKHNEMLRLTLSLLLTAPQGTDISYTFGGEGSIDGTACNIVNAEFAGTIFKLYLGQTSNLPVAMNYTGLKMPNIMMFRNDAAKTGSEPKNNMVFVRKADGPPMETAEFTVKFSDYRSVGGVQLPFKWTQTAGGVADETFDVTSYDINPANIADRFNNDNVKVMVRKDQK